MPVKGDIADDQLHRIASALIEGEFLKPFAWWPFVTLTQTMNPKRVFVVRQTAIGTAGFLRLTPPKGKKWKILYSDIIYQASVDVANRIVSVLMRADGYTVQHWFSETVVAEAQGRYETGSPPGSANSAGIDTVDTRPVITDSMDFGVAVSAGEAADTIVLVAIVEETLNYAP